MPLQRNEPRKIPSETRATTTRSAPYVREVVPLRESRPQEYMPYDLVVSSKEIITMLEEMGDVVRFPEKLPWMYPKI